MANEAPDYDPQRTPESDPELQQRLSEALAESATGLTIPHKEVWSRIEERRSALLTLEEQMKKSA